MKIINRLRNAWTGFRADVGGGVQYRPDSDLWYQHLGYQTATGLRVSPESALRVAAVYACVRVVAETIASLPLIIYKGQSDGGKQRAIDHPLYYRLHSKPNDWQTSYEFWEMMQGHLELRGNSFAHKVSGPDGAIEQLIPLHPDRVSVFRKPDGHLRYQVRYFYTAHIDYYEDWQIFHVRGLSTDGLVGLSTVGIGAETIGCGMAAQEFAARFFENDSTPSGVLTHPKTLTDESHDRLKKDWREKHSGMNQHSVAILEEGLDYKNIGMSNKDSQLLEARQFSRGDIASMFRVPPHKIGDLTRATFSNIEQQNIEFATDCIRPRLVRLERRINTDLLEPLGLNDEYFCEFLMDALMRGDLKSRFEAYSIGINAGILVRNEARSAENYNPLPGLDQPLMPLNLAPVGTNGAPISPSSGPEDVPEASRRWMHDFVHEAAARVVRREVKVLKDIAKRSNGDFSAQASTFYREHRTVVAETMLLDDPAVNAYIGANLGLLAIHGRDAIDIIEEGATDTLTNLALQKERQ